ncbi:MAG: redox-regulated ATPase YchF [Bacteriovorax sp.]|nr:redox-regulated ATPase YchF [Bacteriovorax sp.]
MALNCGIVGLPNVGKSTIFSAITSAPAEAANYPFCTIEPNVGIVAVSDPRMQKIADIIGPEKLIPTSVEFVDIAGLVKGASKGEGLGNQFLGHIRAVNAIIHVVRCFEDGDIIHVHGKVDPKDDIETINLELAFADLEVVEKKLQNIPKLLKSQNKEVLSLAKIQLPLLEKLKIELESGVAARNSSLSDEDKAAVADLNLITMKKVLYLCNVDEEGVTNENNHVKTVREYAAKENSEVQVICGKLESEIASLESLEEKKEFMEAAGIEESGLDKLTRAAYHMIGLKTYFTAGVKEVRAWTFQDGFKAPQCAGVIHTDFERGFIKAEVFSYDDLIKFGSEAKVKEAGKFRVEGKEYVVHDGDIMHFRFNV